MIYHHLWLAVLSLFFIIATVNSEQQNSFNLLDNIRELFKSLFKFDRHETSNNEDYDIRNQKRDYLQLEKPTSLEGSLVPFDENLEVPALLRQVYEGRQASSTCTCSVPVGIFSYCETSCISSEVICGQTCSKTTFFYGQSLSLIYGPAYVSTRVFTDDCPCKVLAVSCSASESIKSVSSEIVRSAAVVVAVGLAAIAVGVGVGVGVPALVNNLDESLSIPSADPIEPNNFFEPPPTPENDLEIPARRSNFPEDGCGSSSVRLQSNRTAVALNDFMKSLNKGNCTILLRRQNCSSPFQWVTLNSTTLQGQCTPRLCGRERVFVGRDGLCYDINDPSQCQGGRRLYYSAFGDSICDCPIGQYPFPTGEDNCVAPFTRGPCPAEMVVTISPQDTLVCAPSQCPSLNSPEGKPFQMVPFGNAGQCFALGTRGPCPASHLLGYDVFARNATCVNMEDPSSPYFSSPEEDEIIDRLYNQPEFNNVQVAPVLFQQNSLKRIDTAQRRQGSGIFQLPSRIPNSLLNPCRPGDKIEFNYKCANPIVPNFGVRDVQKAARSLFTCQSNNFLKETGQCFSDSRGSSCGPSFRYNQNTGQCRKIFL